jgi:ABC-2 type transport system permease protein
MKLLVSLRLELIKIFRQRGTYVSYGILAAVSGLMVWGMWRHGMGHRLEHRMGQEMVVGGRMVTAQSLARYIMEPVFIVLVPMLVAMIVGGLIAGESKTGVLRTWLCRPVSRLTVYGGKLLAAWLHAILLTAFLGAFTLLLGYIFFGGGDLIEARGRLLILDEGLATTRLAFAYGIAALLMCGIAALALLASVLFDNALVAAGAVVAFIPICGILQSLEYFEFLKPYLITTYLDNWRKAFEVDLNFADFTGTLYCVLGYCLLPTLIGAIIFWRRDVTS